MIRWIRGVIIAQEEAKGYMRLVINPYGTDMGVGYEVYVLSHCGENSKVGEIVSLHCYYRHREDGVEIYGFTHKEELVLFEKLVGVSGVGPRSALSIMGFAGVESIISAIQDKQPAFLRAPGIGEKIAAKIIVELTGSFVHSSSVHTISDSSIPDDIVSALEGLGYRFSDIKKKLNGHKFLAQDTKGQIKEALQLMGKRK